MSRLTQSEIDRRRIDQLRRMLKHKKELRRHGAENHWINQEISALGWAIPILEDFINESENAGHDTTTALQPVTRRG